MKEKTIWIKHEHRQKYDLKDFLRDNDYSTINDLEEYHFEVKKFLIQS